MKRGPRIDTIVARIESRLEPGAATALVVAVSGIDASGKSTIAAQVAAALEARGRRVLLVHLDPWHEPPEVRFRATDPGGHFYRHAFRFGDLFALLIEPLRRDRAIDLELELQELPSNRRSAHRFRAAGVDVVLLEGIFLLRRELRSRYDLAVWVDCAFATALERALARNQEGLSEERLREDFRTIYFPAQELHLRRDDPRASADLIIDNQA